MVESNPPQQRTKKGNLLDQDTLLIESRLVLEAVSIADPALRGRMATPVGEQAVRCGLFECKSVSRVRGVANIGLSDEAD